MNLAARVLRFSRENPGVYVPLLAFWILQAAPEALSRILVPPSFGLVELFVGLVRLTFPLFMAATVALILEGIELGRARGRHLLRRTFQLALRALLPWLLLLTLAQVGWRMTHLAGVAFFLGDFLLLAFLPEALSLESTVTGALESSLGLLYDHPGSCLSVTGGGLLLAGAAHLLGVWHFEGFTAFDVHMPEAASPVMVPFVFAGVALMLCRTLIYREIRAPHAVGIEPGW